MNIDEQVIDVFFDKGIISVSISMYYSDEPRKHLSQVEEDAREKLQMNGIDVSGFECSFGDVEEDGKLIKPSREE